MTVAVDSELGAVTTRPYNGFGELQTETAQYNGTDQYSIVLSVCPQADSH